jgi:hypothetical protein
MFSNEMTESVVVIKNSRKWHTSSQKFCSSRQYYNKICASRESNCDVVQLITLNESINYETNYKMLSCISNIITVKSHLFNDLELSDL